MPGDVNNDKQVDISDALIVATSVYLMGKLTTFPPITRQLYYTGGNYVLWVAADSMILQ